MIEETLKAKDINTNVIYHGLISFTLLLRACEKMLKPYDLTLGEYAMLVHLTGVSEEINLSMVKDSTFLFSGASITKVAENLLNRECITRRENPKSRREKLVKITSNGEKLLAKVQKTLSGEFEKVLGGFSTGGKEKLLKSLKQIFDNLQTLDYAE